MKVLVDCAPSSVGGAVQVSIALLLNLQRQSDVEWRAVVPEQTRALMPKDLARDSRLIDVKKRSYRDFAAISAALRSAERAFDPDVTFTVFGPTYFRPRAPHVMGFALPSLIYEADCVHTQRNLLSRVGDTTRGLLFRNAAELVVETQTVKQRLAERLKIDPAKITVIGNSVNPLIAETPATAPPTEGPFKILVPSAYYRHKNLQSVPDIAAALVKRDPAADFVIQLTLSPTSQAWAGIAAKAANLGVGHHVTTLGTLALTQLAIAYGRCHAVLLPTLREASTAVYPEAFHMQRPLVTSDMDFARELCGEAALFCSPHDPPAFADAIHTLMHDYATGEELVTQGRKRLNFYPTADEKFRMQLELMTHVVARSGVSHVSGHKEAAVAFHEQLAAGWDAKYKTGGFKRRERLFSEHILPLVAARGQWLDAGCGSGTFSRMLAARGVDVRGIDASGGMIKSANEEKERLGPFKALTFDVVEDLVPLQAQTASLDGCLCLSVIEYLMEPEAFLDELSRVLKVGGQLVISVPNSRSVIRAVQAIAHHGVLGIDLKWHYRSLSRFETTRRKFTASLVKRGFTVDHIVDFDPIVPSALRRVIAPTLMFFVATKAATSARATTGVLAQKVGALS